MDYGYMEMKDLLRSLLFVFPVGLELMARFLIAGHSVANFIRFRNRRVNDGPSTDTIFCAQVAGVCLFEDHPDLAQISISFSLISKLQ